MRRFRKAPGFNWPSQTSAPTDAIILTIIGGQTRVRAEYTTPIGRLHDLYRIRQIYAPQRPRCNPVPGRLPPRNLRQPLVPRRLQERRRGQDRLRPPLRARHVRRLQEPRHQLLRATPEGRRQPQRLHHPRPHQLLGGRPLQLPRAHPLARIRQDGLPARSHSPTASWTSSATS